MKKFKPFFWFIFGLPILIVIAVAYVQYGLSQEFVLPPDGNEYKVTADISELKLEKPLSDLYYFNKTGLFLKSPEKSESELIFKSEKVRNFFLLEPTQKIAVFTDRELYLLEKDGSNPQRITTFIESEFDAMAFISPQQDKIVFFLILDKQLCIFDANDKTVEKVSVNPTTVDLQNSHAVTAYWLENNSDVIWITSQQIDQKKYSVQILKLNTVNNNIELLKKIDNDDSSNWRKKLHLAELVVPEKLAIPLRDVTNPWVLTGQPVYSPDGKHTYEIRYSHETSKLFVDGTQILKWSAKKGGQYSVVELFQWFDTNHLVFLMADGQYRILELDTHKIAVFFTAPATDSMQRYYKLKWFGQKDYLPEPQEW
jgi:hypothetical protein